MKDFAQEYLKQSDLPQDTDPYLYLTPQVKQQLLQMQSTAFSGLSAANIVAMAVTAPLTVITASLQLSVKPHKRIYQEPQSKSKELIRTNTALTIQEKRRMELMLRSGGEQRPYTAPVYDGYRGAIKGLAAQGWKAFFKGFLFSTFYSFYEIGLITNNIGGAFQATSISAQLLKIWFIQAFCGYSLNTFHIMENRYILQNCIAEFRVFRNAPRVIRKIYSRKEVFNGATYHIFNSFFETFFRLPLYLALRAAPQNAFGALYLIQLVTYPLNTAFRRLTCQNKQIPGMIPLRYSGLGHALRLIAQQEGILGLYRGFGLHHVTMGVRVACMSFLAPYFAKLEQ